MELLFNEPGWNYFVIFLAGFIAYIISTLSGGGGSLLLVPVINILLGAKVVAPVVNLGNLISEPSRIILFRKHIQWEIILYYSPPAIIGAVVSAWLLVNIKIEWLQIFIALFLISSVFQFRFGKKKKSFNMRIEAFIPLGFFIAFIKTMVGAVGPILNPFYLNYGIVKEKMIATKTVNTFIVGLVQISSYTALGSLHGELWIYGIVMGIGASLGNWTGKSLLKKFTDETFIKFVIAVMFISGLLMLIRLIFN